MSLPDLSSILPSFAHRSDRVEHPAGSARSQSFRPTEQSYILVVGGLGYIGSHTTLELAKSGYNVVIVDDMTNSFVAVLDNLRKLTAEHYQAQNRPGDVPDMQFFKVNYRDPVAMSELFRQFAIDDNRSRITGVIHFAAFKSVYESISKPVEYYQNNVCGVVDLVALLRQFGIFNFVFSSSATVYGSAANRGRQLCETDMVHQPTTLPDSSGTVVEPGALGITSPYGRTKYMCEAILADVAIADPRWDITLLRYFNPVGCHESGLLGEHPRQTPTNLVPVLIQVLTGEREQFTVFGSDYDTADGTAVRDFIHVQDLARGHIAALAAATKRISSRDTSRSAPASATNSVRIYNLGTGSGHTVRQVVAAIETAANRSVPAIDVDRRPGDVASCVAAVDKAEQELDWKATKSLTDCARDVWNYTVQSRSFDHNQRTEDEVDISDVPVAETEPDTDTEVRPVCGGARAEPVTKPAPSFISFSNRQPVHA